MNIELTFSTLIAIFMLQCVFLVFMRYKQLVLGKRGISKVFLRVYLSIASTGSVKSPPRLLVEQSV